MTLTEFSPLLARPVARPGCVGLSTVPILEDARYSCTALYFSPHASSDIHTAPFPQMIIVTKGSLWVAVGAERHRVQAGQSVMLPPDVLHHYSTEDEAAEVLALSWNHVRGRSIVLVRDARELARWAAEWFVLCAQRAIQVSGKFTVALAGGSTPRGLYEKLASEEFRAQVDWSRVYFFWGDERAVPPDDMQSNYRMANETLLAKIPVLAENVHRIEAERGAEEAASEYEMILRKFFGELTRFDLILLGLGENGHTASLFPHMRVLREKEKWVVAEHVEEVRAWRITLTAPLINRAANVIFLVSGESKADVFAEVWQRKKSPEEIPALLIEPSEGEVMWLVDCDAAEKIPHLHSAL